MNFIKINSNAKVNLSLTVLKKLKSKFHKIESLISFLDLYDEIFLKKIKNKNHKILFYGKFSKGISNNNTVSKLIKIFDKKKLINNDKYLIKIKKNIPHRSGLGGGSMNAAAVFKYFLKKYNLKLNKTEIFKITSKIGSDTIIGMHKNSTIKLGNSKIKFAKIKRSMHLLLIKPSFGCSTKSIYSNVKTYSKSQINFNNNKFLSNKYLFNLSNDLEKPAFKKYPKLKKIKLFMENLDQILFSRMTGSGSTIIGYFKSKKDCQNAQKILKKKYKNYWCILSKTI